MKRKIIAAILLVIAFAFVLSSCRSIRDNVIVANDVEIGYVGHRDKDGKTYVQDYYAYMIDLNNRSYSVLGKSDKELEEQNKQYAFEYYMHPCGEYFATLPEGYEGLLSHIEEYVDYDSGALIDAGGYASGGTLVGFVRLYTGAVGAGTGFSYAMEKIDKSLIFVYDAKSDVFTVAEELDGALAVAVSGDSVLYFKDRSLYLYDMQNKTEKYLTEHKAYDAGLRQQSLAVAFFSEDACILLFVKAGLKEDKTCMYAFDFLTKEFYELKNK